MSIPEQIGRYLIQERLGQGGMAEVLLARDPYMKREVAVKLMAPVFTTDPDFRARFEQEAQVIARLEHPYIIPVYDFGYYREQPYLVMRYLPGGSILQRLEDYGPMSLGDAARVVERMAEALDAAHSLGVIHRDVKPENILLDTEGKAFLGDFGIVKILGGRGPDTGAFVVGTPAYMSPEQVEGNVKLDPRSDVYALGAVLFELLSGKPPFEHPSPTRLMLKHLSEPVPDINENVEDLPPGVSEVITRAMAKDREERYSTPGEFSQALNAASRSILSRRARKRWMADELADALDALSDEDDE